MASLLLLPYSAMSGIYCGEKHGEETTVHCQHDKDVSILSNAAASEEADCCCNDLFHVLGCQHHCQTAGQASLVTLSPCPLPVTGHAWEKPVVTPFQGIAFPPPYHPPRV